MLYTRLQMEFLKYQNTQFGFDRQQKAMLERYNFIKNHLGILDKRTKFYVVDVSEKLKIINLMKSILLIEENYGIFVPTQVEKYDILIKIFEIQKIKEETQLEFTKPEEKAYYEKLVQELEIWKLERSVYYKTAVTRLTRRKEDLRVYIDSKPETERQDQVQAFIIEFENKYGLVLQIEDKRMILIKMYQMIQQIKFARESGQLNSQELYYYKILI